MWAPLRPRQGGGECCCLCPSRSYERSRARAYGRFNKWSSRGGQRQRNHHPLDGERRTRLQPCAPHSPSDDRPRTNNDETQCDCVHTEHAQAVNLCPLVVGWAPASTKQTDGCWLPSSPPRRREKMKKKPKVHSSRQLCVTHEPSRKYQAAKKISTDTTRNTTKRTHCNHDDEVTEEERRREYTCAAATAPRRPPTRLAASPRRATAVPPIVLTAPPVEPRYFGCCINVSIRSDGLA